MATYTKGCSKVGSFNYATNFTLYVVLEETDIDVNNNRSKIKYNVYCQSSGSGSISSKHTKWFRLNGSDITNESVQVNVSSPNAYIAIASGTTGYITHNNDGTMSVQFGASIKADSYGVSAETSGNFVMSTIPRASGVSCTTANIGETATIIINSAVSSWTHNIWATVGSGDNALTVTVLNKAKGGTYAWIIPENFYEKIPNSKSGTGILLIETWNGDTHIGNKKVNFTFTTSEDKCKPSLSATVVDTNNTTINLTGSTAKLIKHKSTAKVTITTSAKNSATIKIKKVNNTNVSGTTLTISNIETNSFTVTVTDSRGYSNSVTLNPTMINYVPLSISANINRLNSTSSHLLLDFTGNYFNAGFGSVNNTLTMTWKYKKKQDSSYSSAARITPVISQNTYSNGTAALDLGDLFDYQNAYDIQVIVTDKLSTVTSNLSVTNGVPIINWGEDFFNINGRFLIDGLEQTLVDYTSKITAVGGKITGGKVFKAGRIAFWQITYESSETSSWAQIISFPKELEPLVSNKEGTHIYLQGENKDVHGSSSTTPLQIRGKKTDKEGIFLTFCYITKN